MNLVEYYKQQLTEISQAKLRRAATSLLKKQKKLQDINFPLTEKPPASNRRVPIFGLNRADIELANASGNELKGVNVEIRNLLTRADQKFNKAGIRQGRALLRHKMGLPPVPKPGQPNSNQGVKQRTGQSIGAHAQGHLQSGRKLLDRLHYSLPYG
jgi:hypothetical protein